MRQEEGNGLQGDAETDFDAEEGVGGGHFEDLEGVAEIEGFVYSGGAVDLDAGVGEGAFGVGEEFGFGGGFGEVEVGDETDCFYGQTGDSGK